MNLEPFDPKKHKPIPTVGNRYATEYLASEKSPEGKAWNIPTIWFDTETKEPVFLDGDKAWNASKKYEEETGKKFPRFKDIPTAVEAAEKRSNKGGASEKKLTMNKGGATMNNQMNMAFMQEGGMKDDGMDKDPVSGNDIPAGSMAKEVRDDIPAQLSEGEYVVPADVVQYYGVKFFEDLRREAKIGLAQMDRDGRIGGEPVAVTAISIQGVDEEELSPEDEKKLKEMMKANEGGVVGYSNGGKAADEAFLAQQAASNPTAGYQYFGQSIIGGTPNLEKEETWFHPDGRQQVVKYNANGIVTPPTDAQFTQPPWSKNKPSDVEQSLEQTSAAKERKERDPVKLESYPIGDKTVKMTKDNYEALKLSAGKLDMGIEKYYNLPIATRIALIGQETKKEGGDPKEIDRIIEETKDDNFFTSIAKSVYDNSPIGRFFNFLKGEKEIEETKTSKEKRKENENIAKASLAKVTTSNLEDAQKGSDGKPIKTSNDNFIKKDDFSFEDARNRNKGGLLTKPKRKPKKPRGKGLASK